MWAKTCGENPWWMVILWCVSWEGFLFNACVLEGFPILRSWNIRMGLVCWFFPLEFITSTAPPGRFPEAYVNIPIDSLWNNPSYLNVSAILGRIPLLRPTKIGNWPTGGKGGYKLPGHFLVYTPKIMAAWRHTWYKKIVTGQPIFERSPRGQNYRR